jgi:HAD superfamily hydrolase (TIGR01549 family)
MSQQQLKVVLFDFVNTLARKVPTTSDVLSAYIKESFQVTIDPKEIDLQIAKLDEVKLYSTLAARSERDYRRKYYAQFNEELLIRLGIRPSINIDMLFEYMNSLPRTWALFPQVEEVFKKIKERGLSIGVISNFDIDLDSILRADLGIFDFCDYVYCSSVVGMEKPNALFYQGFFSLHMIDVKSCIYFGDNYELDYVAGNQIGLTTYLLDVNNQRSDIEQSITSISEVVKVIDQRMGNSFVSVI